MMFVVVMRVSLFIMLLISMVKHGGERERDREEGLRQWKTSGQSRLAGWSTAPLIGVDLVCLDLQMLNDGDEDRHSCILHLLTTRSTCQWEDE